MSADAPVELLSWFTAEDLVRGAQRAWVVNLTGLAELIVHAALLFTLAFGRPGAALWQRARRAGENWGELPVWRVLGREALAGAIFLGAAALLDSALTFGPALYRDWISARALGLSHESLASFLRRSAVDTALAVSALALLGAALPLVRRRWPRGWWLAVGSAGALALVGDAVVEPLWAHLDYQVRPLPAGALRDRLLQLASDQQADPGEVVVVDASRYGTRVNAFVTGAGPTRRLVLTDTLLDLGDEAVVGAVAHELGHRREERIPRRLALAGAALVALLWLVERLIRFALARGAESDARALAFVLLAVAFLQLATSPVHAAFSRAEEREADRLELAVRHDHAAYAAAQVALVRANAAHPHPHWLLRAFSTHPTAAERIAAALEAQAR